jgi:type I restriction enzyme S subunit
LHTLLARQIKKKLVTGFGGYLFKSNRIREQIKKESQGAKVLGLSSGRLSSISVVYPANEKEQKKIADCLSSVDELITTEAQKLGTLKAHKKGLMQQLFPTKGETLPKLRFPEFRDAGEWEDTTLGECLSRHPEYGINAPSVPYSENLPTYLRITDISDDGQIHQDQRVSVAKDVTDENYLEKGDIVLARTGASVGKAYRYRTEDGRLVFAGFLIRVRTDEKKLSSKFLFQFLGTEQYWRWVAFSSARSGQPGINGNEYASLPLKLPPQLEEQQKIADCLSSIDDLITTQTQKIDALKAHKKGLMQQLFPAMDEVGA